MTQFKADVDLLTRNDSGPRALSGLKWIIVHTTENSDNTTAIDVAKWMQRPEAGGSYNLLSDRWGRTVRSNDDGYVPWAAGSWAANSQGLHLSFTGKAEFSRAKWLGSHDKAISAGAKVVADWSRRYNIPLVKLTAAQLRAGVRGVAGHLECGQAFGGTDHWDPGPQFPYDVLFARARTILDGTPAEPAPVPQPVPNLIDAEAKNNSAWLGSRLHDGERECADGVGCYADFSGGGVYWHPEHTQIDGKPAAIAVPSLIYQVWERHRWEQGFLGYPIRDHAVLDGSLAQAFQGGVIYRLRGSDGAPVHGVIGDRWYREGAEAGPLGWPLGEEQPTTDGGRTQAFEHGQLHWHPSGAVEIREA